MMKREGIIRALLLIGVTLLAYLPAYEGEMIWDDDQHIPSTPALQSVEGLRDIWLKIGATPQYYPLTHTTLWLEWQLWGNRTLGYHVNNVLLHIAASLLVVMILKRFHIRGAWLSGFVFALHPLHVESVVWISERKNTLSIVLVLLAVLTYPYFDRSNQTTDIKRNRILWGVSFICFVLAVLSKTVVCTLPAVILVVIWWKRGRITWRDGLPLLPYFAVAGLATVLTSRMEQDVVRAVGADWSMSFFERLLVAGRALCWYAGKVVWPGELAFSYERWSVDTRSISDWLPVILVIAVMVAALILRNRIGRGLAATLLIFGGTLFPALSFFNLFPHRYSFVADHFQYHSDVVMIAMLCAVLTTVCHRFHVIIRQGSAGLLVALLAIKSYGQSMIYQDSETLWHDTVVKSPNSWLAQVQYADQLVQKFNDPIHLSEAARCYERALELRPQQDPAARSLGEIYARLGRHEDAVEAWMRTESILIDSIKFDPDIYRASKARLRLGNLYERLGRSDDAIAVYQQGDAALPESELFAGRIVKISLGEKRYEQALPYLQKICARHGEDIGFLLLLADCYGNLGRFVEMEQTLLIVGRIDPNHPGVKSGLDRLNSKRERNPATMPGNTLP